MVKKKSLAEDIFEGEYVSAWKIDDTVFIAFPWYTIILPNDNTEQVLEELSKLNSISRNKTKAKSRSKKKTLEPVPWQQDIESILAKEMKTDDAAKERVELFCKCCGDSDSLRNPQEEIQGFLTDLWNDMLIESPVFKVIVSAFKLGQVYQAHRKELDNLNGE